MNLILNQRGHSIVEYATLLVFIALLLLVALSLLGVSISDTFADVNSKI